MSEKWTAADYKKHLAGATKKGSSRKNKKEEEDLSSAIEQWLDLHGYENDRINSGAVIVHKQYTKKDGSKTDHTHKIKLAKRGTPDRWALYKGQWILIETKLKGGKPEPHQIERQQQLEAAGAFIINADSFEQFEREFNTIKRVMDVKL